MIRSSLTSLTGLLVAREVEKGSLPTALSVPLTVMIARLPVPALLLGAAGYAAYKLAKNSRKRPSRRRTARTGHREAGVSGSTQPAQSAIAKR